MAFVKLDCGILDSTLWVDREARELFITSLLMATPKQVDEDIPAINVRDTSESGFHIPPGWYGFVPAAGPGIVRRAGMDRETGLAALERLCDIDEESRTPDFDGRRMARVDGGFLLLNYDKYRQKDHTAAERMRRHRERKSNTVTPSRDVTRRHVTQAEAEAEVQKQNGSDEPSSPMSVTYDQPMTESKTDEGRKEATSEPKSFGDGWQREAVFLKLAAGLNVPESYAKRVFADLEAVGFVSGNGQRIVSPGAFLSELWKRDQNKTDRQENGKRQTWQIEADLKRVKAEIAKITGDKSQRMTFLGHTEPWEAYKLRLGSEWLKVVAECYEAAETELPADVAKFKDWFAEHCREMQKDGVPADMLNADEYRLTKFQEFMPDADVPTFDRWDREWNAKSWIDPNALVPDARAEVDLLKQNEKRLDAERKESLI